MKLYEYILRFKENATDQLRRIREASGRTTKKVRLVDQAFGGIKRTVAGLAIGAALLGATRAAGKLGVQMEQTRVSFTTFLKDAEKANDTIADLNAFSNVTPFDTAQVLQAGKGLLAFGVQQKKIIPTLRTIGDIAAGTGKDFNELVTIYGKARMAGTLYAEDINQLVEAGIPIMGEFARILGTTEDKVKRMASEGKLKFNALEEAFTNLTGQGGLFFDLMNKQSQTVGGKISTLTGKFQLLGASIGENLINPLLDPLLEKGIAMLDTLIDKTGKMTSDYDRQRAKVVGLHRDVEPTLTRYDRLQAAGQPLTKRARAELEELVREIGTAIPSAIAQWDPSGQVTAVSTARARQYIALQEDLFRRQRETLAADRRARLEQIKKDVAFGQALLQQQKHGNVSDDQFAKNLKTLGNLDKEAAEIRALLAQLDGDALRVQSRFAGIAPVPPAKAAAPGTPAPDDRLRHGMETISGGGHRPVNVTVNLNNLIGEQQFTVHNLEESVKEIEEEVTRALLRALGAANEVAAGN